MKRKKLSISIILALAAVLFAVMVYSLSCKRHETKTLLERAIQAKEYCQRKGLNQNYCIFVDYTIPSGTPRLFVWSFEKGKVIYRGYAMHGSGKGSTDKKPVFSNEFGSNCSSLGKFEITRQNGIKNPHGFYLKGLESSNSNARDRGLMIHPAPYVDYHKWRKYIPLSKKCCQGCVTVSCEDIAFITGIMKNEKGNLLLWSYYDE